MLYAREADFLYDIRSDYQIADFHFYVLETPGHSAGGVSIVFPEDHLVLSGDALFAKPSDGPIFRQGTTQLLSSIREELFTLPSSYTVYPGMALRLLLVTRRCSIPSLDNPKESYHPSCPHRSRQKASVNLLLLYLKKTSHGD